MSKVQNGTEEKRVKNLGKQLLKDRYHGQVWQEPLIFDLGTPGERGVLPPELESEIREVVGKPEDLVPAGFLRQTPPTLPEIGQPQVLRHWLRLSEETLCQDNNIDLGLGTCTMKYSPKINEKLVNSHKFADLHPRQDEDTVQGILKILYDFNECLKQISGLDAFSTQGASGANAVFGNARMIRKYQEEQGFGVDKKDEIITTIFSHPCNAASPAVAGYKLITLYPESNGLPSLKSLKAAVSERTAGCIITNPEDTGIYNRDITKFTEAVHAVGGVCGYDQANANGVMGIARAKEAGFDLTHFNMHKTFASPHGSAGPGGGIQGCTTQFEKYLPVPVIGFDGTRYFLDWDRPHSIGKIRSFYGNPQVTFRSWAWVTALGGEGLEMVGETAVLNSNYLAKRCVDEVKGLSMGYPEFKRRLDEIRWSWGKLAEDTGVGTHDVNRRICDYGVTSYFTSHEPWLVPEPMTPEPAETYSKEDLDEYAEILKQVSWEAYNKPELLRDAPFKTAVHKMDMDRLHDISNLVTTMRQKRRLLGRLGERDYSDL
jgi:glycine dehydrogenase subunit 2